jgi:hypothetical protein
LRKPRLFAPGPYDAYEVRPLTKTDNEALRDRDESDAFDEDGLVRTLIERVVRPIRSDEILTSTDAERLAQDSAFLEQLIMILPKLYDARSAFVFRDAQRGIADSKHTVPFVDRLPDESPAAFLLRAWRKYEKREKDMRAVLAETMKSTFPSNHLSAAGQQSLAAGLSASDNLSKLVDRMKVQSKYLPRADLCPESIAITKSAGPLGRGRLSS